jgi:hypothetical protein
MAIDEAMRHRIHDRLETLLGSEEAAALMAALPPSEVATKSDLGDLRAATKNDLEHLREVLMLHTSTTCAELGSMLRAEMSQQYRFMLQWTIGAMLAAGSLGIAAGQLLG